MTIGIRQRITLAQWRTAGGLRNPRLFRRMIGRSWTYWRIL